jgi:hypothetical protein
MAKLEGVKVIDMVDGDVTKVTYGGAEYVKVDGDPKAGDIGLFKENAYIAGDFDIVISIDEAGDPELEDSGNWYAFYLTFFRKVNAPTLTDRVTSLESRVDELGGEKCCTLKVGDYVKVIREYCEHDVDDILKITATAKGHDFRVDRIGHDDYGFINAKRIVRATDEEVEKARAEAKLEPKFKVGNFVKVKLGAKKDYCGRELVGWAKYGQGLINIGSVGEVIEKVDGGIYAKFDRNAEIDGCDVSRFFLADDEYEVLSEIEQKRASIGRKPNEFKKGDIYEITHFQGGSRKGTITAVKRVEESRIFGTDGYYANFDFIKLIAPVEARVDRDGL